MSGLTDRLRQIAGQATPGPWQDDGPWYYPGGDAEHMVSTAVGQKAVALNPPWYVQASVQSNMTHIATFDPVLVGAMLDVIDAAEALVDAPRGSPNGEGLGRAKVRDRLARFREVAG